MAGMLYFIAYLLALVVPGWLIVRIFGFGVGRPLFILAGSYIYYVLLAALSIWLDLGLNVFMVLYVSVLALLGLISLRFHHASSPAEGRRHWAAGLVIVVVAYTAYHFLAGAYSEVPADFLRHLVFARGQLDAIDGGHLGRHHGLAALLAQRGRLWYSFYALLSSVSGGMFNQTYSWAVLANSLTFLVSVYSFAWYLFGSFNLADNRRMFAALLAAFFVAVHMGVNVFSYLRYYALAPTMLNMVVYFAAVVALLELLRWRRQQVHHLLFVLFALLASILVHNQEGLFILVIGGLMLAWFALYPRRLLDGALIGPAERPVLAYRVVLAIGLAGFFGMVLWAYLHLERPGDLANKIIQVSQQGPILNRLLFLNPGYQGFEVITVWGLAVYAIWLLFWRRLSGHPFLFAGMVSPLFTVFNPLFVDWFMRMDGVHTLWRMLYIVPLHFVAALLVVFLLETVSGSVEIWKKGAALVAMSALFVLLLPLNGINPNARITLAPVAKNNSYRQWDDLIDYLNRSQPRPLPVLTDPVTGYVLKAFTRQKTFNYKFFDRHAAEYNFDDYSDAPLKKYHGWLLVINDREGGWSEAGAKSGHWPENILKTSRYYSPALRDYIRQDPRGRFRELWQRDAITVYQLE